MKKTVSNKKGRFFFLDMNDWIINRYYLFLFLNLWVSLKTKLLINTYFSTC